MKPYKRLLISALMLVLLLSFAGTTALAQTDGALVRFMHAIPGASTVDIYVDGQPTVIGLDFGEASTYINVTAGDHIISVTPSGITTELWNQNINAAVNSMLTLIASSTDPLSFRIYEDDFTALDLGETRFRIVHAIANGPALDILLSDGRMISGNLAYGDSTGTIDVPSFAYEIGFTPSGEAIENAIMPVESFALVSNTSQMLVLFGTPTSPSATLLSAPSAAQEDSGRVRLVHAVSGVPAIDILVNDVLVVPALNSGVATEHIVFPAGTHNVTLRATATGADLAAGSITVEANSAMAAVALGTPEDITLSTFPDTFTNISASTALINVINTIPGESSVTATLTDGTPIANNVAFDEASDVVGIAPTTETVSVTITIDGQTGSFDIPVQTFYGGVYYNAFAFSGDAFSAPRLTFIPTSLVRSIASAPGTSVAAVVQPDVSDQSEEPEEVAQVETEEPPPAPTEEPAPVVQDPLTPSEDIYTARVIGINPGANMNLRRTPFTDGEVLGLVPSGSTGLIVLGREGAPFYLEGVEPPPDEEEWVDPAAFLDEEDDLIPEVTWLFVAYNTPDGGTIEAWANALFLDVQNDEGWWPRLADLPMIPNNRTGETIGTTITPPPPLEDRLTATIVGLSPGANLNLRRLPNTDSEILERLPVGTTVEFVGVNEEWDWAFILYLPGDGGSVSGWVTTHYLVYYFNEENYSLERLEERELLVIVDEEEIGLVGVGTTTTSPPTPDPMRDVYIAEVVLDTGANLHLRVAPDTSAESTNLVPDGTRLLVNGRTADEEWLNVVFEEQAGWIAAFYTAISFNGEFVELIDVPILPDQTEIEPEATEEPGT